MKRLYRTPWIARWIFSGRTWGFSSPDTVYLTFDDGPTEALTPWILDCLKEAKVCATFFCVGANAEKYPQLMQTIQEQGHAIGNHTMRHERGTASSYRDFRASIDAAAAHTSTTLFRPPYGRLPMLYARRIKREYTIVMWSWLSFDFDPTISVNTILKQAERIRPGDILVLHDNLKVEDRVKIVLPALLTTLKAKGYKFGIISA